MNIPPLQTPLTTSEKDPQLTTLEKDLVLEMTKEPKSITETDNTLPAVSKLRVYTRKNKTQGKDKVPEPFIVMTQLLDQAHRITHVMRFLTLLMILTYLLHYERVFVLVLCIPYRIMSVFEVSCTCEQV